MTAEDIARVEHRDWSKALHGLILALGTASTPEEARAAFDAVLRGPQPS